MDEFCGPLAVIDVGLSRLEDALGREESRGSPRSPLSSRTREAAERLERALTAVFDRLLCPRVIHSAAMERVRED